MVGYIRIDVKPFALTSKGKTMHRNSRKAYGFTAILTLLFGAVGSAEERARPTLEESVQADGPGFAIRVVDEDGKPVEGAMAGIIAGWDDGKLVILGNDDSVRTGAEGDVTLKYGRDVMKRCGVVAWKVGAKVAGYGKPTAVSGTDGNEVQQITVHPARWVRGELKCSQLEAVDKPVAWTNVYVIQGMERPLCWMSNEGGKYEFLLPAGDYKLEAYGSETFQVHIPLHVDAGEEAVSLDAIDLPLTRLALLKGKPAPELRGVVAWKNSRGLKLADLKGRYVLLDFWGHWCGPCVAGMPNLFAVRDRIPEEKLAIIAVHVGLEGEEEVNTPDKLDAALADVRTELWHDRDLPFPVALVKAEKTPFIEGEGEARSVAAADYGIVFYPTQVLIDSDGNVVKDDVKWGDEGPWLDKLAKLVGAE
jgi:thiol-disulfide isomerase/thioredoxin